MCGMSSVATHRMPCMAVYRLRFAGVVHHRLFPFELGAGVYREYAVGYDLFSFGQSFQDDVGITEGRSQFDFAHQESRGRRVRLPDIDDRTFSGPENGSLRHDDPILIALKGGIDLGGRIHFRF